MTVSTDRVRTNGIWSPDDDTYGLLGTSYLTRRPIKLIVSLVGHCNLRCFHCLGVSGDLVKHSQDPASASRELVDFVVDHVVPDVRAIRVGGVSFTEELISRTFDYFMVRIRPQAARLGAFDLITNLSVMSPSRADLLAACLTDLQVSLEGVEDNFTKLRGFTWARFVHHFQMVVAARQRNPRSRMRITLVICAMSDLLEDCLRFDVFTKLGVDRVILRELSPRTEQHLEHVLYREPEKTAVFVREFARRAHAAGIEAILNIGARYGSPSGDTSTLAASEGASLPPPPRDPSDGLRTCGAPFEVLTVLHTGRFGVCDFVTDLAQPVTDFDNANIMEVWNSPRFQMLRGVVNAKCPPPICLSCEIKVGGLTEGERATLRLRAASERRGEMTSDSWSPMLGTQYVDLHWMKNSPEARAAADAVNGGVAPSAVVAPDIRLRQTRRAWRWMRRKLGSRLRTMLGVPTSITDEPKARKS